MICCFYILDNPDTHSLSLNGKDGEYIFQKIYTKESHMSLEQNEG